MVLFKKITQVLILLGSILHFIACKISDKHKSIEAPAGFDWQGHRGCRGLMPENSLPAFLHALTYKEVTTLELDLAVSKDRQLIVSHEPWFNAAICQMPNGDSISAQREERYLIYEKTVDEIRQFDCGSKGNKRFPEQKKQFTYKPTLREVVEAVRTQYPNRTIRWNIEIKSEPGYDGVKTPKIEDFTDIVVKELRALNLIQDCNLQSFDVRPLQILHRSAPEIQLSYLIENADDVDTNLKKLGFTPQIYSPYHLTVNKNMVKKCHNVNMKLVPWTVNDPSAMRLLIQMGVDGIITDYPNRIKQ